MLQTLNAQAIDIKTIPYSMMDKLVGLSVDMPEPLKGTPIKTDMPLSLQKHIPASSASVPYTAMHPDVIKTPLSETMASHVKAIAARADQKAFKVIYEYYAPRLRSWCMKQRLAQETAEELVQETLIAVWRKAASFNADKASVSTWLFTILRNKRIDLLRKENRPELKSEDFEILVEPEKPADLCMIEATDAQSVNTSLAMLRPEQRSMIMKAFFEEKSHGDIALETGLPLGTVKSRIRLALIRLKISIGTQS